MSREDFSSDSPADLVVIAKAWDAATLYRNQGLHKEAADALMWGVRYAYLRVTQGIGSLPLS